MKKRAPWLLLFSGLLIFSAQTARAMGHWEPRSKALADEIRADFLKEDYASAGKKAERFLARNPSGGESEEILYLEALSLIGLKRPAEAREKLNRLSGSSDPALRASAAVSAADSFYSEGNADAAYEHYEAALARDPAGAEAPYLKVRLSELEPRRSKPPGILFLPPAPVPLKQMAAEEAPFFAVQVGSFSRKRNADGLLKKLLGRGYDAYLENNKDAKREFYRVRVGKAASKEEAEALARHLEKDGYPTKIIP
ncbi:MAG: SPOR domain-containing protein [Candidatus Omnitrophica bacterium]|nr:SPOR domain-containing protein [Candidatus Omnitrophota bacterium]